MTSYSTEFRQRALREGRCAILDKKFIFVNTCNYDDVCDEPCQCCLDYVKKEKDIAKKYNLKPCLVIDTALNSDYDYMVKFNNGKIERVSSSYLYKAIHKKTNEEIEDYNNIDFKSYKLVRI